MSDHPMTKDRALELAQALAYERSRDLRFASNTCAEAQRVAELIDVIREQLRSERGSA